MVVVMNRPCSSTKKPLPVEILSSGLACATGGGCDEARCGRERLWSWWDRRRIRPAHRYDGWSRSGARRPPLQEARRLYEGLPFITEPSDADISTAMRSPFTTPLALFQNAHEAEDTGPILMIAQIFILT